MSDSASHFREAIYKQTTKELVRDKLVSLIASGMLQVGDELPSERELAAMLSVSRETVRGAIQRLAGENIVQVSQGARTRVVSADVDVDHQRIGVTNPNAINGYDLEAVHKARLVVELDVVSQAAKRISKEELQRLEASIVAQKLSLNDPIRYMMCDREFHLTIYYASGSPLLADFVVDLYTYLLRHRRKAMAKAGAISRSLRDHHAILAGLAAHDPAATAAAFRKHIEHIYETTKALGSAGKTPKRASKMSRERRAARPIFSSKPA